MTAEIRPRENWEAVDLGWALARRDFLRMLQAWMVTVVPVWVLTIVLLRNEPLWALGCIWFFKPAYERVPLYVLSRTLFGARPSLKEVVRQWPRMLFRRFFQSLIFRRFSAWRTLVLPVTELEKLKGEVYVRRATVLSGRCGGMAFMVQMSILALLHLGWIGLFMFGLLMMPETQSMNLELFFEDLFNGVWNLSPALIWLGTAAYLVSLTLITPFFVACGFALYLNARARLEGWDIELTFRRLNNRLTDLGVVVNRAAIWLLSGLFGALLMMPSQAQAQQDSAQIEEAMESVMAHPDFEVRKVMRPPVSGRGSGNGDDDDSEDEDETEDDRSSSGRNAAAEGVAALGETAFMVVFIVIAAVVVVMLIAFVLQNLHAFRGRPSGKRTGPEKKATTVLGMNVEAKSLPKNIITAVRELLAEGKVQEAISLLYRGAISWLVNTAELPIRESDTEQECVLHASQAEPGIARYFGQLTRAWVGVAYGNQVPSQGELEQLCQEWPFRARAKGGEA